MQSRPFISIVMPVYNGGDYFPQSLASALAQTYDNFEIVIVNDGSNDGGKTRDFCLRAVEQNPGKIQFIDQPNGGVASALNSGIRNMKGDVFCWLSHDDLYLPEKLERQVEYFNRLGKPDAMLCSDYALIGPQDELIAEVRFDHESFERSPKLPLYRGCINGCTVFIPRGLLPVDPFPEQYRYTQDYWLWFALIKQYTFFHQPDLLVRYRLHPSQDSRKPESIVEGDELWRAAVEDTDELIRTQLYGSSWKFYNETHKILEPAYKEVAAILADKRDTCVRDTLVSVVIPVYNEPDLAIRAIRSARDQTHANLEIIVVNDGSPEDMSSVVEFCASDPRIRVICQENQGAAAARNTGLGACRGSYVAFLDADDMFLPTKIATQLDAMLKAGAVISHTSYYIEYPQRAHEMAYMPSGRQTGMIYPTVLGQCMIATPTVMMNRIVLAGGFQFPNQHIIGEDILGWLDVLSRHEILGIDEALTVVEWSDGSAAVNIAKSIEGMEGIAAQCRQHPVHGRHEGSIRPLDDAVEELRVLADSGQRLNEGLIRAVFKTK